MTNETQKPTVQGNETPKPATPQQTQGAPKPSTDKPVEQQK